MKNVFNMNSRIYVKPDIGALLMKQLLNICLVMILVASVIKIAFDGISVSIIVGMIAAALTLVIFNKKNSTDAHYESVKVVLGISKEKITVEYRELEKSVYTNKILEAKCSEISSIEYSKEGACLHIAGNIRIIRKDSGQAVKQIGEHYVYLEKDVEEEILSCIENTCKIAVKYSNFE